MHKKKMMENNSKLALRLILYMPHAHWRVPFTYQRRHTLALPPYSTVIGLLCNLLGIRNLHGKEAPCQCECCSNIYKQQEPSNSCSHKPDDSLDAVLYHELTHNLELAISGTFKSKTSEYTWFRNLNKDSHVNRFGDVRNRIIDGIAEHPGGQSPVTIDILNDVYLVIYIAHKENCELFLHLLQYAFLNAGDFSELPEDFKDFPGHCSDHQFCSDLRGKWDELRQRCRLSPLHLGRAEDWFRIEDIEIADLKPRSWSGFMNMYIYVPEENVGDLSKARDVPGLRYRIPSFYSLKNKTRMFKYENVFLSDGKIKSRFWIDFIDCSFPKFIAEKLNFNYNTDFCDVVSDMSEMKFPVSLVRLYSRQKIQNNE